MVHRLLSKSRFLILLAVFGCFVLATLLLGYGVVNTVALAFDVVNGTQHDGTKKLLLDCIEFVDIFLLATVFYIIALGLYELFIDDTVPVPEWLEIHTLDDLKIKLIGVVITVLGVLFLGQAVTWDGQSSLLQNGGGIALVIAALSYYGRKK